MDRRFLAGGIVLVLAVSIPVLWTLYSPDVDVSNGDTSDDDTEEVSNHNLTWDVEVGDAFVYSVFHESKSRNTFESYEWRINSYLNNSRIVFAITFLPEIPLVLNRTCFLDDIVHQIKCEVRFENGTEILSAYQERLVTLFSMCLLPIGDWDYIHQLDEPRPEEGGRMIYYYTAIEYQGNFLFAHRGVHDHGGEGLKGEVDLLTGVPLLLEKYSYSAWGDGS